MTLLNFEAVAACGPPAWQPAVNLWQPERGGRSRNLFGYFRKLQVGRVLIRPAMRVTPWRRMSRVGDLSDVREESCSPRELSDLPGRAVSRPTREPQQAGRDVGTQAHDASA